MLDPSPGSGDLVTMAADFRLRFRIYALPEPPQMPDLRVIVIEHGDDPLTLAGHLARYHGDALTILMRHYDFAR